MASTIDNKLLRNSTGLELARYYQRLQKGFESQVIFQRLLDCVYSESIPARVITIWIHGFATTEQLVEAMQYEHSSMVRRVAIRRFGLRLGGSKFPETWQTAGSTAGLLQLMAKLSVWDVAHLCRILSTTSTKNKHRELRQRCMTELVKALVSDFFPGSPLKNPERRPLLKYYSMIVPACTTDFVEQWHANQDLPGVDQFRLFQAHTAHFQKQCLEKFGKHGRDFNFDSYRPLFLCVPPEPVSKQMSQSMKFSLDLLFKFENENGLKANIDAVYQQVAKPLLSRLEKRKHTQDLRENALLILLRGYQLLDSASNSLKLGDDGLFGFIVRLWTEAPAVYDYLLIDYLRICHVGSMDLKVVALSLRYRKDLNQELLTRELLYIPRFKARLEYDSDISRLQGPWPQGLFFSIPKPAASALLSRLRRLKSDNELVFDWSGLGNTILQIEQSERLPMLEILLCEDSAQVGQKAQNSAERCRRKAATSRDQDSRAQAVASVVYFAIASKSLDVLKDTVLWLRKYNRDVMTVKHVYCNNSPFQTKDFFDLLDCVADIGQKIDVAKVEQDVRHANRIMMSLLETACMALREPSFYAPDWKAVRALFPRIVARRTTSVGSLQDKLGLSEDQIYDAVFQDTLQMLIKAETVGLEEDHLKLGLCAKSGPLTWASGYEIKLPSRTVNCRFVDELAKQRNELWEGYRKANHPTVVTLPEPWTKGLPIQSLLQVNIDSTLGRESIARLDGDAMPFLFSRAEKVVFVEQSLALADRPVDKDITDAIGVFIDDYVVALRFYVRASWKFQTQDLRIERAWLHAMQNLTDSSMTAEEAYHFWKVVFKHADLCVPGIASEPPERVDPCLPEVEDPSEPTEWNPDPEPGQWLTHARPLRETCVQLLLKAPVGRDLNMPSRSSLARMHTVFVEQKPVWSRAYDDFELGFWKNIAHPTREALIAMALLLIKGKYCPDSKILSRPFPSEDDARFPALFLADEFLDHTREDFLFVLEGLKHEVPASLGVTLCEVMLTRLEVEEKRPNIEHVVFEVVKSLIEGDRPQSSLELVKHVILHRPNDSSWHRMLFGKHLLKQLPSGVARRFFAEVADEIKDALQQQSTRNKQPGATEEGQSRATVKVGISTVKMLAQVMSGADFIDEHFSVDLLVGLFTSSDHIDIRAAVVGSLVALMLSTKQNVTIAEVLKALEAHAVPVAASPSERHPSSDEDWETAEREGIIPEVDQKGAASPIMDALISAANESSTPDTLRASLISRLVLPALRMSAENNQKWMSLFLKKQGSRLLASTLPSLPFQPQLLATLLSRHTSLVPVELLRTWSDAGLTNIQPSDELQSINRKIMDSPDVRASNAGKHWLSLWHRDHGAAYYHHASVIAPLLLSRFETQLDGGITHEQVMRLFEQHVQVALMQGTDTATPQDGLLRQLAPTFGKNEISWQHWRLYCKPLVSSLLTKIKAMRTPAWQRDPNRKPAVLPDTYEMGLWLLTYPCMPWLPDHAERRRAFASELGVEVEALVSSGRPYHDKFVQLKAAAMKAWPQDYCELATMLGSLDPTADPETLSIADLLRVELADALLRDAKQPKDPSEARNMLCVWKSSPNEEIRMRAIRTMHRAANSNDQKWLVQE